MLDPNRDLFALDPEAFRYIQIAVHCRKFKCLPRAGGLLDQDALTVLAMDYVYEAIDDHPDNQPKSPPKGPKRR